MKIQEITPFSFHEEINKIPAAFKTLIHKINSLLQKFFNWINVSYNNFFYPTTLVLKQPITSSFIEKSLKAFVEATISLYRKGQSYGLIISGTLKLNERAIPIQIGFKLNSQQVIQLTSLPLHAFNRLAKQMGVKLLLSNQTIFERTRAIIFNPLLAQAEESCCISKTLEAYFQTAVDCEGLQAFQPILWNTLKTSDLQDDDILVFSNNRFEKGNSPNPQLPILFDLLRQTYGSGLTEKVFAKLRVKMDQPLTWKLIKNLVISIGAHVSIEDLKKLFSTVKGETSELFYAARYLDDCELLQLIRVERFEDLTTEQIGLLLSAYRTIPNGHHKVPITYLFQSETKEAKTLHLSTVMTTLDADNPLVLREILAKEISYLALQTGQIIPLFDEEGSLEYYEVHALTDLKDGLVASYLTPVKRTSRSEDLYPIELNFRGTQTARQESNAIESVGRDLEFWVGARAIAARKDELLAMLKTLIQRAPKSCKFVLKINGHSLGAADVQRFLEVITEQLSCEDSPEFARIKKICAYAHNAPGLEGSLNAKFQSTLKRLEIQRPDLKIDLTYFYFKSDPVQYIADPFYLGSQILSPLLKRKVILFYSKEITGVAAHSAKPLTNKEHSNIFEREIITDQSAIEKYLAGNVHLFRVATGLKMIPWAITCAIFPMVKALRGQEA